LLSPRTSTFWYTGYGQRHKPSGSQLRVCRHPEERASNGPGSICAESKVAAASYASFRFPEFIHYPNVAKQAHVRCARWQEAARRNKSVSERISCVRKHNSNANFGSNDEPRRNGHGRRKTKDWSNNLFLWEVEMQTNWVSK